MMRGGYGAGSSSGGSITNGVTGETISATPEIWITDTSLSDHGDSSTTGTLAWAIAQVNAITTTANRSVKIRLGPGTFTASTLIQVYDDIAIEGAGIGSTTLNCTATSGGIHFKSGEQWATATAYTVGDYVIPSDSYGAFPFIVHYRCVTAGTSHASTEPTWSSNVTVGNTFSDGTVTWEVVRLPIHSLKECLIDAGTSMTGNLIRFEDCPQATIEDIKFTGGNTSTPNVILRFNRMTQGYVKNVNFIVDGHAMLWDNDNVTVFPYNYGDSEIANVNISLTSTNTYGIKFQGDDTVTKTINNVLLNHIEIVGGGALTDVHIPLWLHSCKRIVVTDIDIEASTLGIMETSNSANVCEWNTINQYKFLPDAAQSAEAVPYSRGIPVQQAITTPYNDVIVRSGYLTFDGFSSWTDSQGTYLTGEDEGTSSRILAASNAVTADTPSAGLTQLTLASTAPTRLRDAAGFARYPSIHNTSNFPSNTGIHGMSNDGVFEGSHQFAGQTLWLGKDATSLYKSCGMQVTDYQSFAFRSEKGSATGLKVTIPQQGGGTPKLEAESGTIEVEHMKLTLQTSAPGTTYAGMLVRADGSGWDPGSGAGTYVRNNADSAWVFIG